MADSMYALLLPLVTARIEQKRVTDLVVEPHLENVGGQLYYIWPPNKTLENIWF